MQEISVTYQVAVYSDGMKTGRPSNRARPPFGERLAEARIKAGISQADLAERLNVNQRLITHWERRSVTLKPEQIVALASVLCVSADELLGIKPARRADQRAAFAKFSTRLRLYPSDNNRK